MDRLDLYVMHPFAAARMLFGKNYLFHWQLVGICMKEMFLRNLLDCVHLAAKCVRLLIVGILQDLVDSVVFSRINCARNAAKVLDRLNRVQWIGIFEMQAENAFARKPPPYVCARQVKRSNTHDNSP